MFYNFFMKEIIIDDEKYLVFIEKKVKTKNMYLRIKDDLNIYVTCNIFFSDRDILKFINANQENIKKMIDKMKKKKERSNSNNNELYYMGKKYDLIYLNNKDVMVGDGKIFVPLNFNIDSWYKKEALIIFQEELDKMYHEFVYQIPYPSLTIRKMKTRWGVCNVKTKRVTLNLELIKKDKIYLDYVIVHELSHLIYANHSKEFWQCVEDNFKDYKKIRKELKNYE